MLYLLAWLVLITPLAITATATPAPPPPLLNLPPSSLHNITTTLALLGSIRCLVPQPQTLPSSLGTCALAFTRLLLDPDTPRSYYHIHSTITIIDIAGCKISIDYARANGQINITRRRIVEYATEVLLRCVHLGQGGWVRLEENEKWIVIVEGSRVALKD